MNSLSENTVFHNRYHLKKLVGQGGMSSVWEALDTLSDTSVAIKIFSFSGILDKQAKESFVNEFRLMFNLTFPYLFRPTHFDIEPQTQSPYLVSKYYKNGSAVSIINKTDTGLDEKLISSFLYCAASALHFLHSLPETIIHQDIKPDNFLIDDDGKFILSDFGVSIRKRATQLMVEGNTNNIAGDSGYLAPERFKGTYAKPAQDIFSLGVTLYEILTGVLPFQNFGGKLLSQGHEIPALDHGFGYTSRLNLICQHCMQQEPELRPTAAKLLEWAEFYNSNNHWPVIPTIKVEIQAANAKFKYAVSLLGRLTSSPLNQIDRHDIEKCIADFHFTQQFSGDFPEVDEHIRKLNILRNNLTDFEKTGEHFDLEFANRNISINALVNLKNQYLKKSYSLSEKFIENKMNLIQNKIDELDIINSEQKLKEEEKEEANKFEKARKLEEQGDLLYQEVKKEVDLQIYSNKSIDTCIEKYEGSYNIVQEPELESKIENAKQLKSVILLERTKLKINRRLSFKKTLTQVTKIAAIFIVLCSLVYAGFRFFPLKKEPTLVIVPIDSSKVQSSSQPSNIITSVSPDNVDPLLNSRPAIPTVNNVSTASESTEEIKITPENKKKADDNLVKSEDQTVSIPEQTADVSNTPVKVSPSDLAKYIVPTIKEKEPIKVKTPPQIKVSSESQTITLPNNSVSYSANCVDEDGSVKSYKWEKLNGEDCSINGANSSQIRISNLKEGIYTFRITVVDNDGLSSSKNVTVKVLPVENIETETKRKRPRRN